MGGANLLCTFMHECYAVFRFYDYRPILILLNQVRRAWCMSESIRLRGLDFRVGTKSKGDKTYIVGLTLSQSHRSTCKSTI